LKAEFKLVFDSSSSAVMEALQEQLHAVEAAVAQPPEVNAAEKGGGKGKGKGPMQKAEFVGNRHPMCPVRISGYAHIAIVVTDESGALDYFGKFGFKETCRESNAVILSNPHTAEQFEVHLLLQTDGVYAGAYGKDTGINVLMDVEDKKPPGHTHFAFNVPSLPTAKGYLALCAVHITGERPNAAIFCRDPDRNVIELIGPLIGKEDALNPESILVSCNHVGTRVVDAHHSYKWYNEMLGFGERLFWYEPASEPKVNGGPWVLCNELQVEINFLLNCSEPAASNVLLDGPLSAGLCPGIVYAAFHLENFEESVRFLESRGVRVFDDAAAITEFGLGTARMTPTSYPQSRFICDPDGSLIRLVGP